MFLSFCLWRPTKTGGTGRYGRYTRAPSTNCGLVSFPGRPSTLRCVVYWSELARGFWRVAPRRSMLYYTDNCTVGVEGPRDDAISSRVTITRRWPMRLPRGDLRSVAHSARTLAYMLYTGCQDSSKKNKIWYLNSIKYLNKINYQIWSLLKRHLTQQNVLRNSQRWILLKPWKCSKIGI